MFPPRKTSIHSRGFCLHEDLFKAKSPGMGKGGKRDSPKAKIPGMAIGEGGRRHSAMKRTGILVASLRSENKGFWPQLKQHRKLVILAVNVSFRVAHKKIMRIPIRHEK